jgi:hypothetical protein
LAHFNPKILPETDIKIEMMNAYKESWLFFEEKIDRFSKGYEMRKAYSVTRSIVKKRVTMRLVIKHLE